jgi:hypothetical protein
MFRIIIHSYYPQKRAKNNSYSHKVPECFSESARHFPALKEKNSATPVGGLRTAEGSPAPGTAVCLRQAAAFFCRSFCRFREKRPFCCIIAAGMTELLIMLIKTF